MNVKRDEKFFEWVISDNDLVTWIDGVEEFFKLPKDYRPDFNPYEYFEGAAQQCIYELDKLAADFGLNKCPQEIVDGIENLRKMADIYEDYSRHVLGLIIKSNPKFHPEGMEK